MRPLLEDITLRKPCFPRIPSSLLLILGLMACEPEAPPSAIPGEPRALTLEPRFPCAGAETPTFRGCLYASPLLDDAASEPQLLIVEGGGSVAAISPKTGELLWKLQLPAPEGEVAMAVATPVMVGRLLVVAYHTISAADSERPDVGHHRKRQRVAVVDLDTRALDPAFPIVELAAQVEGYDGTPVPSSAANFLTNSASSADSALKP